MIDSNFLNIKIITGKNMNYYERLGVSLNALPSEIKTAYKKLILKCHPDKNPNANPEEFQVIQTAYETLSDLDKRKEYDAHLDKENQVEADPSPYSIYKNLFAEIKPLKLGEVNKSFDHLRCWLNEIKQSFQLSQLNMIKFKNDLSWFILFIQCPEEFNFNQQQLKEIEKIIQKTMPIFMAYLAYTDRPLPFSSDSNFIFKIRKNPDCRLSIIIATLLQHKFFIASGLEQGIFNLEDVVKAICVATTAGLTDFVKTLDTLCQTYGLKFSDIFNLNYEKSYDPVHWAIYKQNYSILSWLLAKSITQTKQATLLPKFNHYLTTAQLLKDQPSLDILAAYRQQIADMQLRTLQSSSRPTFFHSVELPETTYQVKNILIFYNPKTVDLLEKRTVKALKKDLIRKLNQTIYAGLEIPKVENLHVIYIATIHNKNSLLKKYTCYYNAYSTLLATQSQNNITPLIISGGKSEAVPENYTHLNCLNLKDTNYHAYQPQCKNISYLNLLDYIVRKACQQEEIPYRILTK